MGFHIISDQKLRPKYLRSIMIPTLYASTLKNDREYITTYFRTIPQKKGKLFYVNKLKK